MIGSPEPSVKSALHPDAQPLWPGIGCSVFLHGGLGVFALVVSWVGPLVMAFFPSCSRVEPLIQDSVEVSVVLPKRLNVPDKAERAVRREKPKKVVPKEVPKPDPVKESDLVVKKKDVPEPEPEGNVEDEQARQKALQDLLDDDELEDILANAPEGKVDRLPTDPDGEVGADPAIAALGARAKGDPAVGRWKNEVTEKVRARFKPIGPRDDLSTIVHVWFDPRTGRIKRYVVAKSSGVLAFDKAAERAIAVAGTIPKPPPAYQALFDVEYVEIEMVP
ncbi:MAG: TonB C-terminal domain-containing protein [Myxococcota bacterium]